MTLSLTFSQSFFEQNVSVQLKLVHFSAIFVISKFSQKCGTFSQKGGNAGNKPKCGISRTIAGRLTPMRQLTVRIVVLAIAVFRDVDNLMPSHRHR